MTDILLILAAYLLGSVSSAVIVCRVMGLPDPRSQGSNNPGATNVLRIGGRRAAMLTLAGDMLKGFLPMLAAQLLDAPPLLLAAVGLAAFLGHLYPVFFGFTGGKGVATALGGQFGLGWQVGGGVAAIWLIMAKLVNISSLSALVAMGLAPVVIWAFIGSPELILMQVLMSLTLFWRHRSNIRSLLDGSEGRISEESGEQ
jgi:glycerol-3-phosphate acyltransferase PlsY